MIPKTIEQCVRCRINYVLGDNETDSSNGCLHCMETPVLFHGEMRGNHHYVEGVLMLTPIEIK